MKQIAFFLGAVFAFFTGAAIAIAFACSVSGCTAAVPIEPQTPANAAQISGCTSEANTSNDLVVGGFVLSGGATAVGAVSALETGTSVRTGLAITSAVLAALTGIDVAWHALVSSEFANGQCSTVVGPLGATPLGARK